jgi:hypothetical protein
MPHSGRTKCSLWLMLIVGSAVAISASPSRAQQPCTTTVECAQAAVTAAAKAQEATKSLDERIKKVEQNKWTIDCVTVGNTAADHRTATCPSDYTVTGCAGGQNKSSMDIGTQGNSCHYQQPDIDWVTARCCRVKSAP